LGLNPKYSDSDSVFLDNPSEEETWKLVQEACSRFRLNLAYYRLYSVCVLSTIKAYFGILPNGDAEIKGLAVAKSNSPRFFIETFQRCVALLAKGRRSPTEFESAKEKIPPTVDAAVQELRSGSVIIEGLEYRVELREEPLEKFASKRLAQPYQAAWLLAQQGKTPARGDTIAFVKVNPFRLGGRNFTVKPTAQASSREINVNDYILSLFTSLSQAFDPMNIKLKMHSTSLSEFA